MFRGYYEDDEDFFSSGMGIRLARSQSFGGVTQYRVQRLSEAHNYNTTAVKDEQEECVVLDDDDSENS
ncbi:unnamed protein product [Toxocara canis]|uniref:F-box/LRR-repeat protein n=1 Tax=Toxocara canis TaxID=6265 RepID=A0A183UGE2_TOXCA|nr:unnamed protein product [Toxocara canis]